MQAQCPGVTDSRRAIDSPTMSKSLFVCQSCGAEHRKWMGQCPDCNAWNSISEETRDAPAVR
ncbi:MAG: hypothetical protein ACE5F3_05450, partial [Mariprofundaceae bacterium]